MKLRRSFDRQPKMGTLKNQRPYFFAMTLIVGIRNEERS